MTDRLAQAERRLDGAIAYRGAGALRRLQRDVRAPVDLHRAARRARSGVVLSSIHHRDQARLYAKQVRDGEGELELSPEEAEAVRLAIAGGEPPR